MRYCVHRSATIKYLVVVAVCMTTGGLFAGETKKTSEPKQHVHTDRYGDPLPQGAVARLGTSRLHPPEQVNSLVFSGDGRFVISGVESLNRGAGNPDQPLQSIWMWESRTGKLIRHLGNSETRVHRLFFSHKNNVLVSSESQGIHLWDMATGKLIRQLNTGKKNEPAAVAMSSDGMTLASCGVYSKTIQIWDMQKITQLRSFGSGDDSIYALELSPDGKILASAHYVSQAVILWDTATGRSLHQFKAIFQSQIAFSPDGKMIAAEEEAGTIQFREVRSGKRIRQSKTLNVHSGTWEGGRPYTFSPNGRILAITTKDGDIRLCDLANGKTIWEYKSVDTAWWSFAFSPDGKILAAGDGNGWVRLLDVSTGKDIHSFAGHRSDVWSVVYVRDGGLVSAGLDGTVRSWNAMTGQEIKILHRMDNEAWTVASSPNGKIIAAGGVDGVIRLLEWPSGKVVRLLHGQRGYAAAKFSPVGNILASNGKDTSISLWNVATGKELCQLKRSAKIKVVVCLDFSPDGQLLAMDDGDSTIEIWEVVGRKLIRHLRGHEGDITSVIFTTNRKYLISGSRDFTLRMWNVDSGHEAMRFQLDPDKAPAITALALSPDSRVLASTEWSHDGIIVRLWEVASGQEICHFHGHTDEIRTLAFSPDGRTVASGSRDCTILVWDAFGLVLKPKVPDPKPSSEKLEELWRMLCDRDLQLAYRAVREMTNASEEAVPFIHNRLRPVPANSVERLAECVKDLDSDDFTTRQKAFTSLEAAAEQAEPVLRKALATRPSLELRFKAEELLRRLSSLNLSPNRLREGRALTVLELIRTPTAMKTLELIGKGAPGAWLTQEANAALQRLKEYRRQQ